MDENRLMQVLEKLITLKVENEIVEFKKAENSYDIDKIGCYLSALANEANIRKVE